VSGLRPTLGHELNNILCKIIGTAELAQDMEGQERLRAELEVIIEMAEEGARLLSEGLRRSPPGDPRCSV
jgi:hypothetical protein